MTSVICPSCGYDFVPPGGLYHVGRLTIDTMHREVCVDARPRYIPRRQFDFIATLARRPGTVLTFDQIADLMGVWEIESPPRIYAKFQADRARHVVGDAVEIRNHRLIGYSIHPRSRHRAIEREAWPR